MMELPLGFRVSGPIGPLARGVLLNVMNEIHHVFNFQLKTRSMRRMRYYEGGLLRSPPE